MRWKAPPPNPKTTGIMLTLLQPRTCGGSPEWAASAGEAAPEGEADPLPASAGRGEAVPTEWAASAGEEALGGGAVLLGPGGE